MPVCHIVVQDQDHLASPGRAYPSQRHQCVPFTGSLRDDFLGSSNCQSLLPGHATLFCLLMIIFLFLAGSSDDVDFNERVVL